MSNLIFGTGNIARITSRRMRSQIFDQAIEAGICTFDTSPYYGYGLAETLLGEYSRRYSIKVNTKFGIYPPNKCVNNYAELIFQKSRSKFHQYFLEQPIFKKTFDLNIAKKSVDESLARLQCEQIDTLFIHDPAFTEINIIEILEFKNSLKDSGKISNLGITGNFSSLAEINLREPKLFDRYQVDFSGLSKSLLSGIPITSTFSIFKGSKFPGDRIQEIRQHLSQNNFDLVVSSRRFEHLEMMSDLV